MKFASLPIATVLRLMATFGFGFFLSMFTRAVSNIVKQPIQLELGLSEEAISLALGGSFFVAFGLSQLPVGILLDRYDPRKVNASLFLLAALGALVMGLSTDGGMLSFGRILMGMGFAGGLMASLKVYALWFPRERLATVISLQFMIGVLGAWSATKPTELLLRMMDWREIYLLFAIITVIAAIFMLTIAPRHDAPVSGETFADQLRGLKSIYTDAYFWRVAPWMFISMAVAQGLGTLYIFSWLTDVAGATVSAAASGVSMVTLVAVVNYAVLGSLAEKLESKGFGPLLLPIVGQTLAMLALALLAVQVMVAVVPQWMLYTLMAASSSLVFAALSKAFPVHLIGRVYTAFNLLGFLTTAAAQWLIGVMLDMFPRSELGGADPEGYRLAFFVLLACQLAAASWFALASYLNIGKTTMLEKNPV